MCFFYSAFLDAQRRCNAVSDALVIGFRLNVVLSQLLMFCIVLFCTCLKGPVPRKLEVEETNR